MEGNEVPKTETPAVMPTGRKGSLIPGRNAVFSLTLASFGNYCLLSAGLLLYLTERIRTGAWVHFIMLAVGIGAIPYMMACGFYAKDGKKRFASPVWKWYAAVVGVLAFLVAVQAMSVKNVFPRVRIIAAFVIFWSTCSVFLPLPQFVERLRSKDWKSAAAALWCVAVMVLLLGGMIFFCDGFPASPVLAAGFGIWLTGYLARAYWYSRLEGIPFGKIFHVFCYFLWIGAVLTYGFHLWYALPKYEKRIAPAREAAARTFGRPIDRKAWEALYYSGGKRADQLVEKYQALAGSEAVRNSRFVEATFESNPDLSRENGALLREEIRNNAAVSALLKADEAVLAALPLRQTLGTGLLWTQPMNHLSVLRQVSRNRLLLGKLALRAKDVPAALKHLSELEALANAAATGPLLVSQSCAGLIGGDALTLAEATFQMEGVTDGQKKLAAETAKRLALNLAKSFRLGWYGEVVFFDEIMTDIRKGSVSLPWFRPFGMRYALPQLAVAAAKAHGESLRRAAGFPRIRKSRPIGLCGILPDFDTKQLKELSDRAKALK